MFRALLVRLAIGLIVLTVAACGVMPAAAPTAATHAPDPPSFATILAALSSDQDQASMDLVQVTTAVNQSPAPGARPCYVLTNDVRYDVEKRLDQGARASTASDAASLQAQLDAKWQELVNLQEYNQEFANNGVAPSNGAWATSAIDGMVGKMTLAASQANQIIGAVNTDVADGYRDYRTAWSQWNCSMSDLLQSPPQIPTVKVKSLPKLTNS